MHFDDAVRSKHDDLPAVAHNNGVIFAYARVTDDEAAPHPQATSSTTPCPTSHVHLAKQNTPPEATTSSASQLPPLPPPAAPLRTSHVHLTTSNTSMAQPQQDAQDQASEDMTDLMSLNGESQMSDTVEDLRDLMSLHGESQMSDAELLALPLPKLAPAQTQPLHADCPPAPCAAMLPSQDAPLPPPQHPPADHTQQPHQGNPDSDEELRNIAFPPETAVPLQPQTGLIHHTPLTHNAVASAKASADTPDALLADSRCMDHTCSDEVAQGHVDKLRSRF